MASRNYAARRTNASPASILSKRKYTACFSRRWNAEELCDDRTLALAALLSHSSGHAQALPTATATVQLQVGGGWTHRQARLRPEGHPGHHRLRATSTSRSTSGSKPMSTTSPSLRPTDLAENQLLDRTAVHLPHDRVQALRQGPGRHRRSRHPGIRRQSRAPSRHTTSLTALGGGIDYRAPSAHRHPRDRPRIPALDLPDTA